LVAGAEEILRHGAAHVAETEEGDIHAELRCCEIESSMKESGASCVM